MTAKEIVEAFCAVDAALATRSTVNTMYLGADLMLEQVCEEDLSVAVGASDVVKGMTKTVYLFDGIDMVFKTPILRRERYVCGQLKSIQENDGIVKHGVNSGDYCEYECSLYSTACKRGLGDVFVPIERCGTLLGGVPLYRSPRVKEVGFKRLPFCEECKLGIFGTPSWVEDAFVLDWGTDKRDELARFCGEFGISDLHDMNCGIGSDGKVRVLDYSSFYENK